MTKQTEELLNLIKENPDLPIIPMVDCEVCGDDSYAWWIGGWSHARVDEYYLGREKVHFRDDDEEDVLADMKGCRYCEDLNGNDIYDLSDEEWNKLYRGLPWKKAIVVYISTYDGEE